MENKPFYLKGTRSNVITDEVIELFLKENPDLDSFISSTKLELRPLDLSDFESFCAWIISQQISGKVAEQLIQRFSTEFEGFTPQDMLEVSEDKLVNLGLSKFKVEYIRNLAEFFSSGYHIDEPDGFSSHELRGHYTKIRGVGEWTVNMWLIFSLGRLDVYAPGDLVIRKGMQILYDLDEIPGVSEAVKIGKSWGHFATVGTILCWDVMGE